MNSFIVHDYICLLIHKTCNLKSYHSDIIYHMTSNIIFSVVSMHVEEYDFDIYFEEYYHISGGKTR